MAEYEFEVKEVSKTTFKGGKEKDPVFVSTLETEDGVSVKVKQDKACSFEVGEIWTLSKSE